MPPSGSPPPEDQQTPSRIARRGFVLAGGGAVVLGAVMAGRWFNLAADVGQGDLSAPDSYTAALAGQITLVDIRRPDEWARTGVGEGAVPIDMRRPDLVEQVLAATGGQRDAPVALICARGVRSARLAAKLETAGFSQILNVPEGMLGSGAGPGWIKRGLPVVAVE